MRSAWFLLLALVLFPGLRAADLSLVRVWTGYRSAESFERISEYFTGEENPGGRTILRSRPEARAGYYWLVRTRAAAPAVVRLELDVLAPGAGAPRTFAFSSRLPAGSHVTLAGLTGADWPDADVRPVAWRLRVLDAAGAELAREESFLWTAPAAP